MFGRGNARGDREALRKLLRAGIPRSKRKMALDDSMTLQALGLDSLAILLVVTSFCDEYGIPVESLEGNAADLHTVADLLDVGEKILRGRSS